MSLVAVKSSEAKFKDGILELQEIFSSFDKLGSEGANGALTVEKLGEVVRSSLGLSCTDDELSDMVAAVDLNASGDVQFNEFLKMMDQARADEELMSGRPLGGDADALHDDEAEHKAAEERAATKAAEKLAREADYVMTREDIKAIFQKFDTDKDGFISFAELKAMFQSHDEKYADDELHAMIHLVDPNQNTGLISYQAFTRLMLSAEE